MEYKTDKLRPTQPFLVLETQDFKQEIYLGIACCVRKGQNEVG